MSKTKSDETREVATAASHGLAITMEPSTVSWGRKRGAIRA